MLIKASVYMTKCGSSLFPGTNLGFPRESHRNPHLQRKIMSSRLFSFFMCMTVYLHVPCVYLAHVARRGQQNWSYDVLSQHVGAGTRSQFLSNSSQCSESLSHLSWKTASSPHYVTLEVHGFSLSDCNPSWHILWVLLVPLLFKQQQGGGRGGT